MEIGCTEPLVHGKYQIPIQLFSSINKRASFSRWQAFTPNQINVLEYREDLKYYYAASYGRTINTNIECEAVADMLRHLESRDLPKVVAYFSHASAIQLFLTALGAAKDSDALRADNYHSMSRRNWRSSAISPFASNFAAIKYECPEENERQKIMFFLNEKPLDFNWCKVGLCNWSDVREMYKRYSRGDCAATYCSMAASSMPTTLLFAVIPLIMLIAFRQWYWLDRMRAGVVWLLYAVCLFAKFKTKTTTTKKRNKNWIRPRAFSLIQFRFYFIQKNKIAILWMRTRLRDCSTSICPFW